MKKVIISILIILCIPSLLAQCADVSEYLPRYYKGILMDYQYFILSYNESHEQADFAAYLITRRRVTLGKRAEVKRMSSFKMDKRIYTKTANTKDYSKTGYDRGHLVPAADMAFDIKALKYSFFMSNVSPQKPKFNRGIWKGLESKVRDWALRYDLLCVIVGPVLTPELPRIGASTRVSVPKAYFKIIYAINQNQMIGFLMSNIGTSEEIKQFAIPVDIIENLTGMDFFERLEDTEEANMESRVVMNFWFE